jgi:hypothetical protein
VRGEVESVLVRNLKERDEFADLGVDGRIILKKIFYLYAPEFYI